MKISIIIPTYNREKLLSLTLSSLSRQTMAKKDYEIIIMDDGSTDGTKSIIMSFANKPNITYLYQEHEGYRVAKIRNICIKRACGEIIVMLDSGMVVPSWFAETHYREHFPETGGNTKDKAVIGYVYGYDLYKDINCMPTCVNFHEPDTTIRNLDIKGLYLDCREWIYQKYKNNLNILKTPWTLFWTSNVSVKREVLHKIGYFDEDFINWGVEDIELGYRLYLQGMEFVISRQGSGIHYPHERDNTVNFQTCLNNRHLFYSKHPSLILELYYSCESSMQFNIDYEQFRTMQNENIGREPFERLLQETGQNRLKQEFNGRKTILIGYHDGFLAQLCSPQISLEFNPTYYTKALKNMPQTKLLPILGVHTEFQNNQFQAALVAIPGYSLPKNFFMSIFQETSRIAAETFFIGKIAGITPEKHTFELQYELENQIRLYKVLKQK